MAFAGLGDALLYPVLPIYGAELGFSTLWIGVFLSINRFVRIPGNTLVAFVVSRKGYKTMMKIASIFAVITTLVYGFSIGIFLFLCARIIWGLSYSALRISALAYAAQAEKNKNLMFGLMQSIKTLGAVLALFIGPLLIRYWNIKISFLIMGFLSLIAVVFAFNLPEIPIDKTKLSFKKLLKFTNVNIISFLTSFIVDGVLVVSISKLFTTYEVEEIIVVVGAYLLFRKLCSSILSILSGWLSDVFGVIKVFKIALLFVLVSFIFIGIGYVRIGIVIAFLFNSFIVAILPSIALKEDSQNKLESLTSITTWWDTGAALGTLVGLSLFEMMGMCYLYFTCFVFLLIPSIIFYKKSASFSNTEHLPNT